MGSDRRLFDLMSRIDDWRISYAVVPPLRILGGRCEPALNHYFQEHFVDGAREDESGGLHGHYFTLSSSLMALWKYLPLPIAYAATVPVLVRQAIAHLKEREPDLVVVGHPSYLCGMVGALAAKACGIPILLDYPDAWTPLGVETAGINPNGLTAKILTHLERYIAGHADRIVSITHALNRYIRDDMRCSAPIEVVANGADDGMFDFESTIDGRAEYGIPSDRKVILYSGRLETWSGVHELTEAIQTVSSRRDDVLFLFVGDGLCADSLAGEIAEAGLQRYVKFLGFQRFADMPKVISTADVAIVPFPKTPTTDVCSPIKLFEYLLMRKAVITTDLEGIREAVGDEVSFIPDLKSGTLSNAILDLLNDPDRRERMGAQGEALTRAHFTWKRLARQFSEEMLRTIAPVDDGIRQHASRFVRTQITPIGDLSSVNSIQSMNL